MPLKPPVNATSWRIAALILSGLLALAVAFVPMIYTPIVASSMKSVARSEIEDHNAKMHEAVAAAKDEKQRAKLLADIVERLDRIEARLQMRKRETR